MKYLRKFNTEAEKNAWLIGSEFVTPNVVLTERVVGYNIYDPEMIPMYIEALEDLTVSFSNTYEYKKNYSTWESATSDTVISASAGDKVYFRASGLSPSSASGIGTFTISNGTCNVAGNVLSMAYGADFKGKTEITENYQFDKLFYNATKIIDASNLLLLATTLTNGCYTYMFEGCTSLVNAPALPATTLTRSCYLCMFEGCTSLVNAPALPATTLGFMCYKHMFEGCTSLVNAPALPATTLISECYLHMFCGCTSLVNAPALPATTLAYRCYSGMFFGCSKLNYIKAMFTTTPSSDYTDSWLARVASTGTFVKNSTATWDVTGTSGVPSGWTIETISVE